MKLVAGSGNTGRCRGAIFSSEKKIQLPSLQLIFQFFKKIIRTTLICDHFLFVLNCSYKKNACRSGSGEAFPFREVVLWLSAVACILSVVD